MFFLNTSLENSRGNGVRILLLLALLWLVIAVWSYVCINFIGTSIVAHYGIFTGYGLIEAIACISKGGQAEALIARRKFDMQLWPNFLIGLGSLTPALEITQGITERISRFQPHCDYLFI